ncbi:MAG: DUF2911 domain-containing protein [Gemmatimonadaceae bacterium]
MLSISRILVPVIAVAFVSTAASAQKTTDLGTGRGGSAHVKTEWTIAGAHIAIAYGRPTLKGRDQATLMPPGRPWRTGADAATVITTDKPLVFGKVVLQPGSYTINTQPGATTWDLIFGKLEKEGQWGVPYLPALEIARTPMAVQTLSKPVEQLTISIDRQGVGHRLRIEWGTVSATAQFTVGK